MDDGSDAATPSGADDEAHRVLAMLAQFADGFERDAQELMAHDDDAARAVARLAGIPTPAEMAGEIRAMSYRVTTMQRIHAEAMRAHAAMIAAGGPDDAEAYAAYGETMARLTALMPDFGARDLGT
ncbi:MAG: hypothetical protein ACRDQF_07415 [Thermocrispum sp.]